MDFGQVNVGASTTLLYNIVLYILAKYDVLDGY
jgi:hypothetical protein